MSSPKASRARNRVNRTETGQLGASRNSRRLAPVLACMTHGSEKLRALARQSRAMSMLVRDPVRARSLISLADLYERQAAEIEAREPELLGA